MQGYIRTRMGTSLLSTVGHVITYARRMIASLPKYIATRLAMPHLYSNLNLIGIHPDIIAYVSPRNHVTLCPSFAYTPIHPKP